MEQFDNRKSYPLKKRERYAEQLLGILAPGTFDQPNAGRALAEFRQNTQRRGVATMFDKIKINRQVQRVLAGIAAVVLLVGLLAWTPVGVLASDFLSIFRVERFVVVGIDPQRVDQVLQAMDQDGFFGKSEVLESGGEPTQVTSLAEAVPLVGFQPLQAAPVFGEPTNILVEHRSVIRFVPDVATLHEIFTMVNLDPELVPENIDGKPFDITVPTGIAATYHALDGLGTYTLIEMPAPTITVPEGVDIEALGGAMLQLLGLTPGEAEQLSNTIDWTTTLVLPIPTDMLSNIREIDIRGTKGVMFQNDIEDQANHEAAFMWEQNGRLYILSGMGVSTDNVLSFADSLQ
ncbi:MAG: hypothetical protein JXB07_14115 [Anaerolineae bacterium]|nr:hypothetical protein [Anaerolineae bacterium]